jgi:hypothetical protein
MSRHVVSAIAELHAARSAMQSALIALDQAVNRGEYVDAAHVRLIQAELRGAGEEAAVFVALLTGSAIRPAPGG